MKVIFTSLGCDKNLADSEKLLGLLASEGFEITDDESEAEAAVINTCCFIHDAKQESINTILETARLKEDGKLKYLVILGCLAERYGEEILTELPEVDAIIGTTAYDELAAVLKALNKGTLKNKLVKKDKNLLPTINAKRANPYYMHYSYLKIAEGCDKHCTYCVIPSIKGKYRSVPKEELIAEARDLVQTGVNELILVAQETSLYGTDIYGYKALPELIRELCAIPELKMLRIMYCYPEEMTDEIIETIKSEPKVAHYLDLPIQHISDNVLKRMGRRTSSKDIYDLIKKLRKAIPDIAIRTSLITGFPGETEEEHQELLKFITKAHLDRVGVFTYSKEENTPAAKMKGQITKKIKEQRRMELMLAQQACSLKANEKMMGKCVDVIIDGYMAEDDVYVGRTYKDAPGIDGNVFVHAISEHMTGDIIRAKVTDAREYDLVAVEVKRRK